MKAVDVLFNPNAPSLHDPIDREAINVVKGWLQGEAPQEQPFMLALTPDTLTQMTFDIAMAMRKVKSGQI